MPSQSAKSLKLPPDKEALVINNLNLVRTVIRDRFSVYHEYYDDMFQEGAIGLTKAVMKHDESRGAQLSTLAYICIKNEIQKFVSERTDTIKVPVSVGLALNSIREVEKRGGTEAEKQEVLTHNQISIEMLKAGERALQTVSMDVELEDGTPYRELIPGKVLELEVNADLDDRRMYSELHNWLNFYYQDRLLYNRVYIDYLYMSSQDDIGMNEIYRTMKNTYFTNRNEVRRIIAMYNEIIKEYFKYRKLL